MLAKEIVPLVVTGPPVKPVPVATLVTVPDPPEGTQVSEPDPSLVNEPDALAGQTDDPIVSPETVAAPVDNVPVVEIF